MLYSSLCSSGDTTVFQAPGGNDDGSGTISLLAIAHRIGELGLKFHTNVELVAFAGEEQGLFGSKAYARTCSISVCSLFADAIQGNCVHGTPT